MSQELHTEALSFSRKMIAASSAITARKACIHSLTRADVTLARKVIREQKEKGEDLSFTAYVVLCLARALSEFPEMNSYRRRNSLVFLPDLAVSVQVEREFNGARVPEPVIIRNGHQKSLSEITRELRNAKANPDGRMGGLSRAVWIRFIPGFLLKTFVRWADGNPAMARKFGKVGVTAVGMFGQEPQWFLPHGSGTVLLTVGGIERTWVWDGEGHVEKEHLCLTGTFDHAVIDGAPAARFMSRLLEILRKGP